MSEAKGKKKKKNDSEGGSRKSTRAKSMATDKPTYWRRLPPTVSAAYENRRWHEVHSDLKELILEEDGMFKNKKGLPIDPKPINKREKAFDLVLNRYIRYIQIARRMDDCYNYMVHPQKRMLVKKVLIGVLTRILEFKHELILLDEREYHFIDDIVQDFRLVPEDLELPVPRFFIKERSDVLKSREHILDSLLQRLESYAAETAKAEDEGWGLAEMSVFNAVLLIQRNQRGYIGRRLFDSKAAIIMAAKRDFTAFSRKFYDKWVCYIERKKTKIKKKEQMEDLGMLPTTDNFVANIENHITRNQAVANEHLAAYEEDQILTEETLLQTEGYDMAWNLKYNITQWLLEVKDLLGTFPVYPPEEKGGSNLLFTNKSVAEVENQILVWMEEKANKKGKKGKGKKDKKKDKKKKDKKGGKAKKGKGKKGEEEEFEWTIKRSQALNDLMDAEDTYQKFWLYKDDCDNITQSHDRELMKENIRLRVGETVRKEVDELMRFEIENMKVAIELAKRKKETKGRKAKKGKGGKKKKGKKGKKGKKVKDLTKDRTMEDLYEELVMNGIIRKSDSVNLSDFLGDYSYTGCLTQEAGLNPLPPLADVRKLITELAVLPLGSGEIHTQAPLNRSLLIAGVRGTGKNMLVNAICQETGANLFDIRPSNLLGKYSSSKKEKQMLMHLLMKVGKALEPSVLWIDECEKMFLKKKDKADTSKPHTWVALMKKTFKKIKNGDRILLLGTTRRPSLCKQKGLTKFFNRIVIVPHPDYSSRYMMWKHFITQMSGLQELDLDLTSLTKVTTGFTAHAIKSACQDVITPARLEKMKNFNASLTTFEFARKIAKYDPIYRAEYEDFLKWYEKTPLTKKRLRRLKGDDEDGGKGGKGGKGKKRDGGKKKKKK